MAPSTNKRKRPDRQASEDDVSGRPSPYRPEKSRTSRRTSQGKLATDEAESGRETESAAPEIRKSTEHHATSEPPANPPIRAATTTSRDGIETPAPASQRAPDASSEMNGNGVSDVVMKDRTTAKPSSPYRYQHVTCDLVASWAEAGSKSVVELARAADEMQLSDIMLELVRSALEGRLSGKHSGLAIREIISARKDDGLDVDFLAINTISFLYDASYKGAVLRELVASTGLDQQVMREELDIPLLQELGLVRITFDKMRTRKTTNALYRQANFNLLREESEGYAKLLTEFFSTAQEASNRPDDNPYIAEDAFQRVLALVGAFDLDVGRVLDITMDISASLLVKAYPFFVKFYRASSWWPQNEMLDNIKFDDQGFGSLPEWAFPRSGRTQRSDDDKAEVAKLTNSRDVLFWQRVKSVGMDAFFELGARKITNYDEVLPLLEFEAKPEVDSRGKEPDPHKRLRLNQDRKFMRDTRILPPPGNYDAAQLLGFKLRFYSSSARSRKDELPDNLIFLAALLIKIGFISLRDLYPHLHPSDEDMPKEKARLEKLKAEKEAKERPGGGMNALLMAGALADEGPPPRRMDKERSGAATPAQDKKAESKADEELPAPRNQKLVLLKGLLAIGALPEALHILGRFPWLAEFDYDLPQYIHRLGRHMLSKFAEFLQPLGDRPAIQNLRKQLFDTTAGADGTLVFTDRPAKRAIRHMYCDFVSKDDGNEYRHYYQDWSDNVPVCQTIEDVFLLCDTLLGYLGANVGQDVMLYGTLLRLAHQSLTTDRSENNRSRWLKLMKRLLVPALSCGKHNVQLSHQVFDLLCFWPTEIRYNVYAEWFTGATSRRPEVRTAFARNKAEVRDVLRRVSNDTSKRQSRALGKVALAAPGIVTMEVVSQIQSHSNMIPSLVECTKYFSPLAYDVLSWTLISSMSGAGQSRIQADGMLTSSWLSALSQFVAVLYSRQAHLNISPMLQYLASEFRVGDSTDLGMFEEILKEMAGIRPDMDINDAQVLAMAGGETLQIQILSQLSDRRHEKKGSAQRLVKALKGPGLIGQILVAIAQEQQMNAHHQSSRFMPLKVLGWNVDKVQACFQQYLEVLRYTLTAEEFEAAIPDATSLVRDYGIEPGTALTICRTALHHRMNATDAIIKQESSKQESDEKNGDIAMKDAAAVKEEIDNASGTPEPETGSVNTTDATATTSQPRPSPWHPVLEPIITNLTEHLPDLASRVSIPFYVTFWTLAHQDILMPMESYQKEVKRLDAEIIAIASDRSDVTAIVAKERDKRKRSLIDVREKLKQEPKQHLGAYMSVRNRISKKERHHWFARSDLANAAQRADLEAKHSALLQECFLPRAMLSPFDAFFSFQMLKILHDNGTTGFSLMHMLTQLFKKQQLTSIIFQCTEKESQNFGRFLCELLKLLMSWHADKATYEQEALGSTKKLPGFVKKWHEHGEPEVVMDWETYRRFIYNHHTCLSQALLSCFESKEYMHIRNGIIVLRSIWQVFPSVKHMGKNLIDHLERLNKEDDRNDIKVSAGTLFGFIKNGREKSWVLPQAFRLNDPAKDGPRAGSRATSARAETPQPSAGTPKLNASAAEFKPSPVTLVNGTGRKESAAGGPEDGEIEDEKPAKSKDGDVEMKDEATSVAKLTQKPSRGDVKAPSAARNTPRAESKPATPAPVDRRPPLSSSNSQRPDSSHQTPTVASRIEPVPSRPLPGQQSSRNSGRHGGRDDGYGRLERPSEARPGSRDQSPGHRSRGRTPPGAASRSYRDERPFDRPLERDARLPRDDARTISRRETPLQSRDRPQPVSRASDGGVHPDRMNHISSVVTADGQQGSRPSSRGTTTSEPPQQDGQVIVNPARLAMINADPSANASSPRRGREGLDTRRERDARPEERGPLRNDGRVRPPLDAPGRPEQQVDIAPTGPKRGRLREMGPPQSESSYGRLNASQDAPSGPRQSNGPPGRGGRNFTAPINTRNNDPPAASPTMSRPPDSPAAFRPPARQSSGSGQQFDRGSAHGSAPGTPASENGPAMHPSRAAAFGQVPPPINTSVAPNGPRNAAGSPTASAPSGPRGPGRAGLPSGTPTGPSPASAAPPSGPASANERQRRTERQRNSINATLQGTSNGAGPNGQGVNFRGASSRQPSFTAAPPNGPGSGPRSNVPTIASSMEPPLNRPQFDSRQSFDGPGNPQRQELFQSRQSDTPSRHREDDRSGRPRDSRDPSREPRRDNAGPMSQPPPPPPPGGPEDGRDRRGPRDDRRPRDQGIPRDGPARDSQQRHPERQPRGPGDMQGSFGGPPRPDWERGNEARGPRRDGPPDDGRRGGRMPGPNQDMRGPPRGPGAPDERREPSARGPRDDGAAQDRKRRHEETGGFDPKRRRSAK
ncbi:THO complex subunit 2 [Fulvia fulva]|nr:THO complex subunit 2 [Fulvia fulva]WPV15739.1 THO complex subunit 2 [Fulvia fulva]WPV30813.1 THO complex subunit 2 [Fulvia fulva]